jgi:hypothetical protein
VYGVAHLLLWQMSLGLRRPSRRGLVQLTNPRSGWGHILILRGGLMVHVVWERYGVVVG